jgi:hypothetical protein
MSHFGAPTEIGFNGLKDLERLRSENSQLRGLVVDLSKLVLVNVASQGGRFNRNPADQARPYPAMSVDGALEDNSANQLGTSKLER